MKRIGSAPLQIKKPESNVKPKILGMPIPVFAGVTGGTLLLVGLALYFILKK